MNFVSLTPNASNGSAVQATIIGGDEAALRKFLSLYVGGLGLSLSQTTLYIGQLPDKLPPDLPIPKNAEIVGSVVRDQDYSEALFIVAGSPQAVAGQYESMLTDAGWRTVSWPIFNQGFADQGVEFRRFCNEAARLALSFSVKTGAQDENVFRVTVNREPHPCQSPHLGPDSYRYLPTLKTPSGVKMTMLGSGSGSFRLGGQRYVSSSARLISEIAMPELATAYHEQIKALGNWQPVMIQSLDHSSISTWIVTQDEGKWSGYFMLVTNPSVTNEYVATIHMYEQIEGIN